MCEPCDGLMTTPMHQSVSLRKYLHRKSIEVLV